MDRNMRSGAADARGECGDSLLRLALMELYAEEAESAAACADDGAMLPDKMSRMLSERIRIRRAVEGICHAVPRAIGIAAAMIVISCAFVTGALAVSKTARDYLKNYIFSIDGNQVQLVASDNGSGFDAPGVFSDDALVRIPGEWKGDYYPSYIPDGFELLGLTDGDSSRYVLYTNECGESFEFEESENTIRFLVDTEEIDIDTADIDGMEIKRIQNKAEVMYLWSYGGKALCLRYDGDNDLAFEIVRSVRKIN